MRYLHLAWDDAFGTPDKKSKPESNQQESLLYLNPTSDKLSTTTYLDLEHFLQKVPLQDFLQEMFGSRDLSRVDKDSLKFYKYSDTQYFYFEMESDPSGYYVYSNSGDLQSSAEAYLLDNFDAEKFDEFGGDYSNIPSSDIQWCSYIYQEWLDSEVQNYMYDFKLPSREEVYQALGEDPDRPDNSWERAKEKYLDQVAEEAKEIYEEQLSEPVSYLSDIGYEIKDAVEKGWIKVDWNSVAKDFSEDYFSNSSFEEMATFVHFNFKHIWEIYRGHQDWIIVEAECL